MLFSHRRLNILASLRYKSQARVIYSQSSLHNMYVLYVTLQGPRASAILCLIASIALVKQNFVSYETMDKAAAFCAQIASLL